MSSAHRGVEGYVTSEWRHVPALDGMRAIAVTGVLVFHAGAGWMGGGFLGVDLFFVLSGWLITGLLLHEMRASHTIDLVAFWGRRVRRLIPAVLLMLVAVVVWWSAMAAPTERLAVLRDAPSALLYAANWQQIAAHAGYWASFDAPSPLTHLWSLAIEEQFYLVWPVVLALVARRHRREHVVLGVCLAGIAGAVAVSWLVSNGEATHAYMGTDTRAASLLLGGAFATAPARRAVGALCRWLGGAVDPPLLGIGLVLTVMWTRVDGGDARWLFRGGLLLHALMAAAAIALVAASPASRAARSLSWTPLRWIGVRSYSLYLWHWPVFVWFTAERTGLGGPLTTAICFALSLALADVSYRVIENPIRTGAVWARGWRGAASLSAAMAVATTFVAVIPRPPAGPDRPDTAAMAQALVVPAGPGEVAVGAVAKSATLEVDSEILALVARPPSGPQALTPSRTSPSTPTTTPATTVPPTTVPAPTTTTVALEPITIESVAWFGDSIAYDTAGGLEGALGAAGVSFNNYSFAGESLTGNLFIEEESWLHKRIPKALARRGEALVIWQLSMLDYGAPADVKLATLTSFVELALADHDAVLFVTAPPLEDPAGEVGKDELEQAAHTVAARYPGRAGVIDTSVLWGDGYVRLDASGQPLRKSDGIHLCPLGVARYAAWLTVELSARFNGIAPADPAEWATGSWWDDSRYRTPAGACVVDA